MTPNKHRSRVKVYDTEDIAREMRETFQAAPVRKREEMPFGWPKSLQHVGDSLSVAYASNKWKEDPGDFELFKHLAESHNRCLCKPGVLRSYHNHESKWKVIGPTVTLDSMPLPRHFAVLGMFEEIDLRLFVDGTDEEPEFGRNKSDGCVKVTLATKIPWSAVEDEDEDFGWREHDDPILFVYTKADGVLMLIVGDELAVGKDGVEG